MEVRGQLRATATLPPDKGGWVGHSKRFEEEEKLSFL
jgi:hypothetical protein